jgi:hypothetical protein
VATDWPSNVLDQLVHTTAVVINWQSAKGVDMRVIFLREQLLAEFHRGHLGIVRMKGATKVSYGGPELMHKLKLQKKVH